MATLSIVEHNNRLCITGHDDDTYYSEVFKQAIDQGLITEGWKYFMGWGRWFFVKDGNCIKSYQMRENWNGWHDRGRWVYPTMEEWGGKVIEANPSIGQHRDVWVSKDA